MLFDRKNKRFAFCKSHILATIICVMALIVSVVCVSALDAEEMDESATEAVSSDVVERVNVTICFGGYEYTACNSPLMNVGELLDKLGVDYSGEVVLNYDTEENLFEGMNIKIERCTTEIYTEKVELPFETRYIDVQTIPKGTTKLSSKGKNGSAIITHEIKYVDGIEIADTVVSSETISAPADEVYYRGVGGSVTAKDGTVYAFSYYIDTTATAYKTGGITATGKEATDGIVAVDPRVISYGTKMFITGKWGEVGVCSAEDTGGGIKGNRIDICMSGTLQDLLNFGRRQMRVYILE